MTNVLSVTALVTIEHVSCGTCGAHFGLETTRHRIAKDTGELFYCPNGHHIGYKTTEVARLKTELEKTQRAVEFHKKNAGAERRAREEEQASHSRTRAVLTTVKNAKKRLGERIKNGVCPCCHRSFENLRRHMTTKHPKVKL